MFLIDYEKNDNAGEMLCLTISLNANKKEIEIY